MPVVWALRGFVSICNIRGPNNPVPVIDREISLVPLGWDCNVFRPPHPLFPPLTDASAAIQRD